MGLGSLLPLIVLGAMGPTTAAYEYEPVGLPEPIATRQTLFAIPFRVDESADPAAAPAEVHLYVSADQGGNWQLYARAAPTERRFLFRAGGEGEYWFQVRTLDRSGRPSPPPSDGPGLRVVVDTTPPRLQLEAVHGEAGQITARWQVDDANPDAGSLVLQYRTSEAPDWQVVAVDHHAQQISAGSVAGRVTWWPQTQSGLIQVRAEVADRAGNPAVSHAQVNLAGPAEQVAAMPPAGPVPVPGPSDSGWRPSSEAPATAWPSQQGHWQDPATGPPYGASPPGPTAVAGYRDDPPGAQSPAPYGPAQAAGTPAAPHGPYAENVPGRATGLSPDQPGSPDSPAAISSAAGGAPAPGPAVPSQQSVRMVNSPAFELDYQTEPADPAGIRAVELWGTEDQGRTWRRFAVDDDTRSPLLVQVDREGLYGFRLVIWDVSGRATPQPRPGAAPEVWVGVDLTPPHARLTGAQLDQSSPTPHLLVTWEADDWSLAPGPVSLFFSPHPGGPWEPIVREYDNTGRFLWPIDRPLPERVFLRIEVRDQAGNVGTHETVEPVTLVVREPEVSIRQVRPLDPSSGPGPKRYYIR